ncbi:MAG: bifunctional precorrin-2 dehydrogenase/sirohydrochlorin ferrochelatase [Candidatus Acidiferrales bacterium]
MSLFPMFVKLEGRSCLVVGAGTIAEGKIRSLLEAGAIVCVVSPRATPSVHGWSATGAIKWLRRRFERDDLDGKFLVIAATSSAKVNARVFEEARKRKVLCNSVDDPPHCDFFYAAVVRRGDLQIAISTNGKSPALAQRLRKRFERQFGPEYADKINELGAARARLFRAPMEPVRRRKLLLRMAREVRLGESK